MIRKARMFSVAESIRTEGFHHQPGFLTAAEARGIKELYENTRRSTNKNYPIKQIIDCSVFAPSVLAKVEQLQRDCFPEEELMLHGAVFFAVNTRDPKNSVNFAFHQDHESYFAFQEHYFYLNFYIAIEKEDVENSNLTVVPFSALKDKDPLMHDLVVGQGATEFHERSLQNDSYGTSYQFDFDLKEIAVTPRLAVGDALAMRGDIIHKTQNQAANRIAVSFRSVRKNSICNRRQVLFPSRKKLSIINKNYEMYAGIDYVFSRQKRDYLTVEELFTRLIELQKQADKKAPLDVIYHVAKYKLRLMLLRATCGMW